MKPHGHVDTTTKNNKCIVHVLQHAETGPCVDGGTADSLQREQLEKILDTVYPITGNPTPYATLLTPDHGINMYFTEFDPLTAYQVMLGGIGDASNIWTNYSPCPTCVRALLDKYNKPEDEKPTIHVAGIYTESNSVTHIVESLECLGKLVHGGFSIVPWNFKAPEGVPAFLDTCNSDIDVYYGNSYFTSAYTKLERLVTFIQQLGANPHANLWCTA